MNTFTNPLSIPKQWSFRFTDENANIFIFISVSEKSTWGVENKIFIVLC